MRYETYMVAERGAEGLRVALQSLAEMAEAARYVGRSTENIERAAQLLRELSAKVQETDEAVGAAYAPTEGWIDLPWEVDFEISKVPNGALLRAGLREGVLVIQGIQTGNYSFPSVLQHIQKFKLNVLEAPGRLLVVPSVGTREDAERVLKDLFGAKLKA